MDKRKSLRELQARLADKLQAAKMGNVSSAALWLAVTAGGSNYLFPLSQSGEIYAWTQMHNVAHTKNWYLGVANLRGALFGVADFASFVQNKPPQNRSTQLQAESRLITFSAELEVNCALLVDKIDGLRSAESFVSSSLPQNHAQGFLGSTYVDLNGVHWQEINLQVLSQQAGFLNINVEQ